MNIILISHTCGRRYDANPTGNVPGATPCDDPAAHKHYARPTGDVKYTVTVSVDVDIPGDLSDDELEDTVLDAARHYLRDGDYVVHDYHEIRAQ